MQISKKCIWKVGLSGLLIMCTPCCFSRSCEVNNRRPYVETTSVHDLLPHTKPCAGFSWILVYVFLIKSCREGRLAYWQSCFTLGRTWISPLFAKFFKGVVWGLVSVTPPPPPHTLPPAVEQPSFVKFGTVKAILYPRARATFSHNFYISFRFG